MGRPAAALPPSHRLRSLQLLSTCCQIYLVPCHPLPPPPHRCTRPCSLPAEEFGSLSILVPTSCWIELVPCAVLPCSRFKRHILGPWPCQLWFLHSSHQSSLSAWSFTVQGCPFTSRSRLSPLTGPCETVLAASSACSLCGGCVDVQSVMDCKENQG